MYRMLHKRRGSDLNRISDRGLSFGADLDCHQILPFNPSPPPPPKKKKKKNPHTPPHTHAHLHTPPPSHTYPHTPSHTHTLTYTHTLPHTSTSTHSPTHPHTSTHSPTHPHTPTHTHPVRQLMFARAKLDIECDTRFMTGKAIRFKFHL